MTCAKLHLLTKPRRVLLTDDQLSIAEETFGLKGMGRLQIATHYMNRGGGKESLIGIQNPSKAPMHLVLFLKSSLYFQGTTNK